MSEGMTDKVAIVTGASRGIGLAVADAVLATGVEVTILADDEAVHVTGEDVARRHGRSVAALRCDITDSAAVRDAISGIEQVDVLVNYAGNEQITPLLAEGDEVERAFRHVPEVSVLVPSTSRATSCRACLPTR